MSTVTIVRMSKSRIFFVTTLLTLCGLTVGSNIYTLVPITKELSDTFHVPLATSALASSIFSIFYALGFLVFGPLSDRVGRKSILVYGMLALAIVTLATAFAPSMTYLLALRAIQGFVGATIAPVALAYVMDVYPLEKRATTVAFITTGFLMAGIVGQVVSTSITHALGWSYVFITFAMIHFVTFLFLLVLPGVSATNPGANLLRAWRTMLGLLAQGTLVRTYLVTITLLLSFVGMYSSLNGYLGHDLGLTKAQMMSFRVFGIIGMLPSPLAGQLSKRFGLKQTFMTGLLVAVLGLLLERGAHDLVFITLASILFVFGITLAIPTLISILGVFAGAKRGPAMALFMFVLFLGASIGPMLVSVGSFAVVSLVLIVLLILAFLIALTFPSHPAK